MARDSKVVFRTITRVKGANTTPKVALRKQLFARGLRFRLHRRDLPGKPDIMFVSRRLAVFVDGDFWHGGQWKRHGFKSLEHQLESVNNRDYWLKKINSNIHRDKENNKKLHAMGWKVLRIWESDVKK